MAQTTQLSPTATPGRKRATFVAKVPPAVVAGVLKIRRADGTWGVITVT